MIIKLNLTGIPSIRLKVSNKLTHQNHVTRKLDKYGRRIVTYWVTSNTEVTLERYHANKNSKDVDGLIYVGRAFQQYMDKFDIAFGYHLAGVRAFTKFFQTNGKDFEDATALAEYVMDTVIENKGKASVVVSGFGKAFAKQVVADEAAPANEKKRGRPRKDTTPVQEKRRRDCHRKQPV
jgi:hypothetical protein